MKFLVLLLALASCAIHTFVMPTATTSPEERNVLTSYPIIPVEQEPIK